MIRARLILPTAVLVLALTGCGGDSGEPAAAPTSQPPAATRAAPATSAAGTAENDRWACRQLNGTPNLSPDANIGPAEIAAASSNPGIAKAGRELREAALEARNNPSADANAEVLKAQLALAEACASLFGDGPW